MRGTYGEAMHETGDMEKSSLRKKGRNIAITGKGGSGKTALTAIMTGLLARTGDFKILAIDADSAVGLPYALGAKIGKTVAEIRRQIIENPEARAEIRDKNIRLVIADILQSGNGFQLLVMGRPEGPGCYCSVNDLLRYGIDSLSHQFDITLIDCEAGPEQVNRRVVQGVDVLVIVTDASIRGIQAAGAIREVVQRDEAMRSTQTGLIINRSKGGDELITERAKQWGLEILGCIPEDENITKYDSVGKPIIDLPRTSPSVVAVEEILKSMVP